MNRVNEFKGFNMLADDDSDMISFVSGSLSGAFGFADEKDEFRAPSTEAEAQKKSELQSLLLMASLMLGGREALNGA
jgi:hypothetical protein